MAYNEPRIDRNWRNDSVLRGRPFLAVGIALLLMVVALSLTVFKGCTGYGGAGKHDIYNPADDLADDEGFIGISNTLFDSLLAIQRADVEAVDLESLNRRYPAIEFALPYGEDHQAVIEASDLRVVGIHPEYIHDQRLRDFYYNSRLPQLFNHQRDNMADTYFRISTEPQNYDAAKHTRPIVIKKIRVNSAMFKVALVRNPWTGTITANSSCLFPEGRTVYLAYGNSMLPLPVEDQESRKDNITYRVDPAASLLTDANGRPIDYYEHYLQLFNPSNDQRMTCVAIDFPLTGKDKSDEHYFSLCCTKGKLHFRLYGTQIVVYDGQSEATVIKPTPNKIKTTTVGLVDGMKLVVYNADKTRKLGEFTITTSDPTATLSRLVQTQTGASRYTLSPTQTDLFTQQMVRALSQHLTNRTGVDNVAISLDPLLSHEFEKEVCNYLHAQQAEIERNKPDRQQNCQYDISLTVLDLATGNVLAQPFYTTKFDNKELPDELRLTTRNVALSRRYLGSTFKPILALAAVETDPGLLDLTLGSNCQRKNDDEATFFGYKTALWASKTSHWNNNCNFVDFISHSDDVYPAALAAWALSGSPYTPGASVLPLDAHGSYLISNNGWLNLRTNHSATKGTDSPFIGWLTHITAANTASEDLPSDRLFRYLPGLEAVTDTNDHFLGIEEVSPEVTNLHTEMFLQGGGFRGTVVPWVLGQGSNDWSALQIATAWARMLTGHDIEASYVLDNSGRKPLSLFEDTDSTDVPQSITRRQPTPAQRRATWGRFLDLFNEAQTQHSSDQRYNTLAHMNNALNDLNNDLGRSGAASLRLFSKTGTPDGYTRSEVPTIGGSRRYFDIGLYTFGIMTDGQMQLAKSGQVPQGIVCVVRITRTYQCKYCDKASNSQCETCRTYDGITSTRARNFFSADKDRLRKFYDMTAKYY